MSGTDQATGSSLAAADGPVTGSKIVTAALVIIGNEVLSGRTRDGNTAFLATRLNELGVRLMEVRVVRDDHAAIAAAVNALRASFDYVFTTGGIGPTHDDITADAIARAFGVPLIEHPEALARLTRHYARGEFTPERRRMACVPEGADLIDNPVSAAPGFRIANVFVMAGVPRIMQAMFEGVRHNLVGGAPLISRTIRTDLPEGKIAGRLRGIQDAFPEVEIGSYPQMHMRGPGVRLVLRATDPARLDAAVTALQGALTALGGTAEEFRITAEGAEDGTGDGG